MIMTINIKKNGDKEWEITEVVTVIKKVEVKADSYDEAKEIYDEQYHELDWWVDEEYVDDYDIEEIE
jgi:ribosomal protein S20